MRERTLQGALTFLGFAVSVIAVFYFAIEYIPRVSEWTQVAALILLGLCFAFLGVSLRPTSVGQPFFSGPRLQWLRPPVVLYLLAIFSGVVAEIRFLSIDAGPKPVNILVSLVLGIGLIVAVARRSTRQGKDEPEPAGEGPRVMPPSLPPPAPASRPAASGKPRASAKRAAPKAAAKKAKR